MYNTIKEYFDTEYGTNYQKKVEELSKSQDGKSLVSGDFLAYSFDDIFKKDKKTQKLHSVDAVVPYEDKLVLIEFKSGFEDKVNKNTFKKSQHEENKLCDKDNKDCKKLIDFLSYYYKLLYEKRKSQKLELVSSLKLKLYDAVFFVKNNVFPNCSQKRKDLEIIYIIVVDSLYIESRENTVSGVNKDNILTPGKSVLIQSKMNVCQRLFDAENKPLCDKLVVVTAEEFLRQCNCELKEFS